MALRVGTRGHWDPRGPLQSASVAPQLADFRFVAAHGKRLGCYPSAPDPRQAATHDDGLPGHYPPSGTAL